MQACNFIKKEALAQVFYCKFCDIFKSTFFTEHLRTTSSGVCSFIRLYVFSYTTVTNGINDY